MVTVQHGDARDLPLDDASVACVVTSPPYNVGVDYGDHFVDRMKWREYEHLAMDACREMARVLEPGGRAWINVMPSVPLEDGSRYDLTGCWQGGLELAGLKFRDTVVWVQDSHDGACAWGSWRKPSSPNLRGGYEHIICSFKPPYRRRRPQTVDPQWEDGNDDLGGVWTELVRNVWTMRPERRREGAPAPFPVDLPLRCIRLSTWHGETVLDPFAGSGTTVAAAERLGRVGLGFDLGAPPPNPNPTGEQ